MVQARRKAGVVGVHALELADSKHVQHLRSHPKEYLAALEAFEEAELLGRGDRYLSSGMLAVAADATRAVEAAKKAAAASAAAAAAAALAASSTPLPADSANKNTATVTVVRGGSGAGGALEKAGSEKMGAVLPPSRTTSSLAAALSRVLLHRSSSAPKVESITTSAGTWTSPFGAVSANAKLAAVASPSPSSKGGDNNAVSVARDGALAIARRAAGGRPGHRRDARGGRDRVPCRGARCRDLRENWGSLSRVEREREREERD